jgi:hypothetical protein
MKKTQQILFFLFCFLGIQLHWTSKALSQTDLPSEAQVEAAIRKVSPQLNREVNVWIKYDREHTYTKTTKYQAEQRQLTIYRKLWTDRLQDSTVAELLGHWYGPFGSAISIFPTQNPTAVCVQSIDEEGTSIGLQIVRSGKIFWSANRRTAATFKYKGMMANILVVPAPKHVVVWSYSKVPQLQEENRQLADQLGCITE